MYSVYENKSKYERLFSQIRNCLANEDVKTNKMKVVISKKGSMHELFTIKRIDENNNCYNKKEVQLTAMNIFFNYGLPEIIVDES